MAHKDPSRVRETTVTAGTGTYALAGAAVGFRAFSEALSNGDTVDYCVVMGVNYEIGRGTYSAGTLARTTVLKSSNADAAVDWPVGTKDIFAARAGLTDEDATGFAGFLKLLNQGGAAAFFTVRAATTADITIATALNNGDTLDGVSLATGDLVLVKNQSAPAANGIYIVGATPARVIEDFDILAGCLVLVREGSVNADTFYAGTADRGGTLDTTSLTFATFGGGLGEVLDDTSPQLGGDLDPNGHGIAFPGATITDALDEDNMASNSATAVPTQQSVKAYVDALLAAQDAMVFKGVINCSANPNYPAADAGHVYSVSVAGKIGGASGVNVEVGDSLLCITDSTASGDQATVGANWVIRQVNLDGAVIGPASATDGYAVLFDGTSGKLIKVAGAAPLLVTAIGVTVQGFDADTLKADVADNLTAGFTEGVTDDGTKSSGTYTPTPAAGTLSKKIVNGGAFTLAPYSPGNDTIVRLTVLIINNGSAGAITTSGFDHVIGSFDTTDTNRFTCHIEIWDIGGTEYSKLTIEAHQ